MTTLEIIGLVTQGLVVIVLVFVVVPTLVLHLLRRPLEARVAASYGPDEVLMKDLGARTFGRESWGVWQGRGNGALVLTADCLHFFRLVPGADVRVPLGAVTEVTFTKSHLGKATIHDLLIVRFSVDGQPDSIALYLNDPNGWKNRMEELLSGRPAGEWH